MKELVSVFCKNNGITKEYRPGTSLLEIYHDMNVKMKYQVVNARVNNKTESLLFKVYKPKDIEFVSITDTSGMRAYVRSLCFIMYMAAEELFPGSRMRMEHPVSKGYYCSIDLDRPITEQDVSELKLKMQEIIDQDIPIEYIQDRTSTIVEHFNKVGFIDIANLLETSGTLYTGYYKMQDYIDYYYGSLVPSTGFIYLFDLMKINGGILLRIPNRRHPQLLDDATHQPMMLEVFAENLKWNKLIGIENVGDFNKIVHKNDTQTSALIQVTEALHEKKIAQIADDIFNRIEYKGGAKFILVSGPSSSGKTTFSKRLSIQLMTNGIKPVALSLDDYFVNRVDTPRDEKGEYDYECLQALDLSLFQEQLNQLILGEEIKLPTYSFESGERIYKGNTMKLEENMVLIIEGIHALNPELTKSIDENLKYKVYVSALTTISLDNHNWIPTADNRLLRRIIRDHSYRGYSARDTIQRWPSVRSGEEKWIFPYQERADVMFNSALLFELAVIKKYVEPVLMEVPQHCEEYAEAKRLLRFLSYIKPIYDTEIPPTSLLREFLGGSSFRY